MDGVVHQVGIEDELQQAYLSYAMSVIVSRALPDVRDGLKPVQRRILYVMHELGLGLSATYKKSARIVGKVLGEYHPHGDTVVYEAMARMAQDFSLRYPLVDGQGNFGCFTGDTKIRLLDGTERSFEELTRLDPNEVFYVYSVDKNGRIVVGEGRNARVTRRNAQIIELILDNGETIRCTPDHRFMLRDGTYKEAQHLSPDDSLMPELLDEAERYNHRIVAIRWPDERADVYDIAVDEHHNFLLACGVFVHNSVDGDNPAAMRYTEARLATIATEMLADIQKDTVDLVPNFDDTLREPVVLPAAIPNLLVNGSSGIAVGMATSIPPHNLGEVCDALIYLLDNWKRVEDIGVEDLMRFIQGPDFPTGGIVYRETPDGEDALAAAYGTGRGRITVRARVHMEMDRPRQRLVVTEIPYQVNKSNLVERIAELARQGHLEGIADMRDESDRHGIRVVIELARGAEPEAVLADLFRHTPLESTFSVILLALVDREPRLLTLKKALLLYLEHRQEIITRRSRYDLERAKERAHILEGLMVALDNLDEVIDVIRRSRTTETARTNLMRRFKLTEIQAQAILDMPLKRLAALERQKIQEEYKEKQKQIHYLTSLLKSPAKIRAVIREELVAIKQKYADGRRAEISGAPAAALSAEELVPDVPVWVAVMEDGRVARTPDEGQTPTLPARLEKTALPVALLRASTRDILYIFTADGRWVAYPIHQLPEGVAWEGSGRPIADIVQWAGPLTVAAALTAGGKPGGEAEGHFPYLFLATRQGMVKRVAVADLPLVGSGIAIGVGEGDRVVGAAWTTGEDEVILVTRASQAIRFREDEVRPMGLPAAGVLGIKLEREGEKGREREEDGVIALGVVRPKGELLVVTEDSRGKRTPLQEYPLQGRYGKGVITARFAAPEVGLAAAAVVSGDAPLLLITCAGAVKATRVRSVPKMDRPDQGRSLIPLRRGDRVKRVLVLG